MNTEEHRLCFLKTLQNIHLGQPRITFPSPFCVADVGQSIITLFQINKILKLLEDGNATGVRQSSMLGERVCRRGNQTCSLSEAQHHNAIIHYHRQMYTIYIYIRIYKWMEPS
jgi:hypothetical protein